MSKKVSFVGCSFTVGEGFPLDQRHLVYDRLLEKMFGFTRNNCAQEGASNHLIFVKACEILRDNVDLLIVQWSALNRLWLYPGPDTFFFLNDNRPCYSYRDIYLSQKDKSRLADQLKVLNHDYHNILELINYCDILCRLSKYHGKPVIFINGLVPWTADLNHPLGNDLSSSLSEYSKNILDFDNRPDKEIREFFIQLQQKFQILDQSKWVNLFDSFQSNTVDLGPEGHHPGPQSHAIMASKIADYLVKNSYF